MLRSCTCFQAHSPATNTWLGLRCILSCLSGANLAEPVRLVGDVSTRGEGGVFYLLLHASTRFVLLCSAVGVHLY